MADVEFVQVRLKKDKDAVGVVPAAALDYYKERGFEEIPKTKQVDVVPLPALDEPNTGTATGNAEK